MQTPSYQGLLVRFPPGAGAALGAAGRASLAGAGFELEPLFSAGASGDATGLAASAHAWHLARPVAAASVENAWDEAHRALGMLGAAGADFIEPDLLQEWPFDRPRNDDLGAAAASACSFDDQAGEARVSRRFAWHLDDQFSQLRAARDRAGPPAAGRAVRIAHLDTGYDPDHATYPRAQIDADLQRNFIDKSSPHDARDRGVDGMLKNPGHGAGTLSILAGARFTFSNGTYVFDDVLAGAPHSRIVPVRVGNSVVQLSTSSVARGISYAAELGDSGHPVDVLSMSMGGVASRAWADAVNKAYEAGVVLVTAAGNNFSGGLFAVPTRFIVYPARFQRVIAVCGVMANREPYYALGLGQMQGNWGPDKKMATAIAAFTPNMPWAQIGCPGIVDMNGAGTSAATPQVAAAAALYIQVHAAALAAYPDKWMRVEAVREALFNAAEQRQDKEDRKKLGRGVLRAADALKWLPPGAGELNRTTKASASFAFLRVLTGLGIAPTVAGMLELEATQLTQRWARGDTPNPLELAIDDPDAEPDSIPDAQRRRFFEAAESHPGASAALRTAVRRYLGGPPRQSAPKRGMTAESVPAPSDAREYVPPTPPYRRLRAFALDPALATRLETAPISQMCFDVPWEPLQPGPVCEYLEVIDVDPGSDCAYEPVNLDDPRLLAQDGHPPSEGTPQFHQQMVYAVCSLTIDNFEKALGRKALWGHGPSPVPRNPHNDSHYVQRLRVYPHALREPNAYYSPDKVALLFGYFNAGTRLDDLPGGRVFTCLSHDVVAHETTHALLDGMHREFLHDSNPDVRAFHEAFADIVALLQHFTFPEIVRHQIAATRGRIRDQNSLLGALAVQFGHATGLRGSLRNAIGQVGSDGSWVPHVPSPEEYQRTLEAHDRGAILVAAVFDAFLSIYERRSADLIRLATGGTGVLVPGAIHPDLVRRLADEAAKSAQHVLTMCIRALDYCPPTDITFGEYLRAIITADGDLIPDDDLNYRTALIESFRRRGIYPGGLRTLGVESLRWGGPQDDWRPPSAGLASGLERLRAYAHAHLYAQSRRQIFDLQRTMRRDLHTWLTRHFAAHPHGRTDAEFLGLDPARKFEVRTARFAYRTSPDGGVIPQLLVGLLQGVPRPEDPEDPSGKPLQFQGGASIVADLRSARIQYCIRKRTTNERRLEDQQRHAARARQSLRATYLDGMSSREPFAVLHRRAPGM